jgi:hypothetical protein
MTAFLLASLLMTSPVFAQAPAAAAPTDCEAKAVSKSGKPLAGAAKTSFLKKCNAGAGAAAPVDNGCAAKAVSKSGKPLAGAAKASFLKKCNADQAAAK